LVPGATVLVSIRTAGGGLVTITSRVTVPGAVVTTSRLTSVVVVVVVTGGGVSTQLLMNSITDMGAKIVVFILKDLLL
jgi:hypothetical protein